MESQMIDELETLASSAVYPGKKKIELWSLVLQAVAIPHELLEVDGLWQIYLRPENLNDANQQITEFEAENSAWPPAQPLAEPLAKEESAPFFIMTAMLIFYGVTGPWYEHSAWFANGAVSSQKIFVDGEWWRLITGLTLHADAGHLIGNLFFGGIFLYFLAQQFGGGTASLLALLSGSLGNLLNIMFRQEAHLSVGFSTAVFGMVGAFCICRWFRTGFSSRELLISLGASFSLLALLGTGGGERTDFGAHIWGMGVGIVLGGIYSLPLFARQAKSRLVQYGGHLIFVVMIWISWYRALR